VADLVFNIAKGRVAELANRVKNNDPATSALIIVPVDVAAVTDATLRDFDTLAAILAGGVTERSTSNWNRKTLTDADLGALAPDDTNDRYDIDIPDPLWTPGPTAGAVTDLIVCYDSDTLGGTDANIIPLTLHDFAITPDGSEVTAVVNAAGFYRAA
jgi:hypothetical protein